MQPLNLPGTDFESGSWSNMLVPVGKTGWGWVGWVHSSFLFFFHFKRGLCFHQTSTFYSLPFRILTKKTHNKNFCSCLCTKLRKLFKHHFCDRKEGEKFHHNQRKLYLEERDLRGTDSGLGPGHPNANQSLLGEGFQSEPAWGGGGGGSGGGGVGGGGGRKQPS